MEGENGHTRKVKLHIGEAGFCSDLEHGAKVERAPHDTRTYDRSEGDGTPTQPGSPRGSPNAQEGPRGATKQPGEDRNKARRNYYCPAEKATCDSQADCQESGPERGRGMTLVEPARPSSVVATRRHGRGAPGPISCSTWISHRAHPPSGAG
eukprot:422971-Pyramimonas_sp.AAC.2